ADYRVTVAGGTLGDEVFTGKLVADVTDGGPTVGIMDVNAITTLVAAYRDQHPKVSPAHAKTAVRRVLEPPHGFDVTGQGRGENPWFSAGWFDQQAQSAGGIQPFVRTLVRQMDDRTATHPFPGAPQNDITQDAMKMAAKAAVKYGLKQLLSQVGLEPPDVVIS